MPRDERSTFDRQMHIAKLQEKKTNSSMAWADYKKVCDMIFHSQIIATMVMVGLSENIIGFIKKSMNKWETNLHADGKLLKSVPIRRGIFQGDSFSPLLFLIALLPLAHTLRETGMGYQLEKNGVKVNHLFFMDNLKLYGRYDKEMVFQNVSQYRGKEERKQDGKEFNYRMDSKQTKEMLEDTNIQAFQYSIKKCVTK